LRTIVVTGSASGIGAAARARLEAGGARVLGVDLRDAEVVADLATRSGRAEALERIGKLAGERIEGLVTCAGVAGLPGRPGSLLTALNYFGTVELLEGMRPWLARGAAPAAVAISSNSTTTSPLVPRELSDLLLAGDAEGAAALADRLGSLAAYAPSKLAVAHWVRRHAPTADWIGAGITLNAVAPGKTETAMIAEGRADPLIGPHIDRFPVPAGRSGQPEEIAALIAFLLGPDARFFCGSVVFCDGGTDAQARADDWPAPLPKP
jgi:NAD(P)-dependent dehydrogenase (short-subunit alcohol dehydrogenase family)